MYTTMSCLKARELPIGAPRPSNTRKKKEGSGASFGVLTARDNVAVGSGATGSILG